MQIVVISPVLDVVLADQIHGADQLHALEIRAVQLRHHGLHLSAVQHPHEDRLDNIIVMVSQSDLIAPQLLCMAIQIASAHSGTQIAGGILDIIHRIKYLGFKNRNGNIHQLRIVLDDLAVRLTVTGIHHQKYQFKGELVVTLQLLEQLCHQHGILTTRDTYGDLVVLLDHVILIDSFGKSGKQDFMEFFADAFFNLPCPLVFFFSGLFLLHQVQKPPGIAAL